METMFEEACKAGTLRDAVKRAAVTFDLLQLGAPNSSSRPRPKTGRDRKSPYQLSWLGRRSETRSLRTLSQCSEMLPSLRCSHLESFASSLGNQNYSRRWRPLSHLHLRSPKGWADTALPPCGGAVASEPTRSPLGANARLGVRLTEDYTRRCRRLQPTRSGTEDDRKRTTTNRVYPPPSRAEALNFGRQADPGADRISLPASE
jgi:hypothetical protein